MQIGCSFDYRDPAQWAIIKEAGFTWAKVGVDLEKPRAKLKQEEFAWAKRLGGHGIEPVFDVRCGVSEFARSAPRKGWYWDSIRQRWENSHLFRMFGRYSRWLAARSGVRHLEIWGEAPCMAVGERFFEGDRYPQLLRIASGEIKRARRGTQVWFGGHGVNGILMHWQASEPITHRHYDWNNLHPFFHDRDWLTIERAAVGMFDTLRIHGHGQPIGMTEFGWPTHADGSGIPFKSNVQNAVLSCSEEEAALWTDRFFRICEAAGVRCVIWNNLIDGTGYHWGAHCGLLRHDGTQKAVFDVVRDWAQHGARART